MVRLIGLIFAATIILFVALALFVQARRRRPNWRAKLQKKYEDYTNSKEISRLVERANDWGGCAVGYVFRVANWSQLEDLYAGVNNRVHTLEVLSNYGVEFASNLRSMELAIQWQNPDDFEKYRHAAIATLNNIVAIRDADF